MTDLSRRGALGLSAAALAVAPAAKAAVLDAPHPALGKSLTRIAFGSCANQDKDQPIWEAIFDAKPDLFVFLGDNIYADTRDPKVMAAKYATLAAKPHFKRLRDTVPVIAIWDDHDFGENDAGADYPMKVESRRQFCDFWGEPADSPRRTRDGVYAAYVFGPAGQRVQVILPDLRWNRTPLAEKTFKGGYKVWATARGLSGKETPGPYDRIPDLTATMIGEPQWTWLEQQLAQPADLRIFGSSLQVLADFAGWESWINYARDHQRLLDAIRRAPGLRIEASLPARVEFLLRDYDYAMADPAWLVERLDQLKGLQSNETLERWRSLIAERNFPALVEELLTLHYDPLYQRSQTSNFNSYADSVRYTTDQLDAAALDQLAAEILATSA